MIRVLVLGAGGLGCEILKNLISYQEYISEIHLVDLDYIELTNLNRQFLFTDEDIGKPKATTAVNSIRSRIPNLIVKLVAHVADLTTFNVDFIQLFDFVLSGLDSIEARRWMNKMLVDITRMTNFDKCIPLIDGGVEGFQGHIKTIVPGITSCWECSMGTLPPIDEMSSAPLCTIANQPRNMDHVIQYVILKTFPNANLEDAADVSKLVRLCKERATEFQVAFTEQELSPHYIIGKIKKIIPSVCTTNAVIAGQCCIELLKIYHDLVDLEGYKNFTILNGANSVFSYSYCHEKVQDCVVCSGL